MTFAPIILFVYNRLWHTKRTVEALQKNLYANQSILYIYSDAAKAKGSIEKVEEVRNYIKTITGFNKLEIIYRSENMGLANSIISGVTEVFNTYDKVIVLEDDLVTSPYFIEYMNRALEFYEDNKSIFSVTGFSFDNKFMDFPNDYKHDVYLNIRPMSWSWGTWKERWLPIDWSMKDFPQFISNQKMISKFNSGGTDLTQMLIGQYNGSLDSWYIRWSYHAIMNDLLTVYPVKSFIHNIGHDGSGIHCGSDKLNIFAHNDMTSKNSFDFFSEPKLNKEIVRKFNSAFNIKFKNIIRSKLKRIIYKILTTTTDPVTVWLSKYLRARLIEFKNRKNNLRIGNMSLLQKCKVGKFITIYDSVTINNAVIGDFTYVAPNTEINNTKLGKFCSIGPDCRIGLTMHPTKDFVSTHPIFFSPLKQAQITFSDRSYFNDREIVEIGNDVWIGANAIILGGIKINDGAIIAAGAVVTSNVPAYAIVGGVPAKILKFRFTEDEIKSLIKIRWWDKDIQFLKENYKDFFNIKEFIKKYVN